MGRIATLLEDEKILAFVLLSPALILILVFIAYPFVLGIWMSLTDKLVGTPGEFVGLSNYLRLLDSDISYRCVEHGVLHLHGNRVQGGAGDVARRPAQSEIPPCTDNAGDGVAAVHRADGAEHLGLALDVPMPPSASSTGSCAGYGRWRSVCSTS
jgi:ABC-type sugar transport system permease subunit